MLKVEKDLTLKSNKDKQELAELFLKVKDEMTENIQSGI